MLGLKLLKDHQPPWYRWLERVLTPVQPAVVLLLLLVAGVSLYVAWRGPNWLRTAWLVYLVSP